MKANELRIGNWVMDRGDKIWQIHSWDSYEKVCANPPFLGDSDLGQITGHPLTEYVDYLKPIPLTEEWLLKLPNNHGGITFEWRNSRLRILFFGYYLTTCDYVHEWQNLYFALTGQELTIKE